MSQWGSLEEKKLAFSKKERNGKLPVTIRFPDSLLREIDESIEVEELPISRNTWILDAALEKLRKPKARNMKNGTK